MVLLPENEQTTIAAIERAVVSKADDGLRPHLGASQIGHPCDRKLYYAFRWAVKPQHSGRIHRLFARGHREESVFEDLLRAAGITVVTVDPDTGKQYSFSELGGHFGGSMDGTGKGLPEAPKTWHVLEYKTHSAKSFAKLKKEGVQAAKPEHYAQLQSYMRWTGLERALYLAVNKDDDDLYGERVKFDREEAERLAVRAKRIIESPTPAPRISEDPAWYLCKFCEFSEICHSTRLPEVNCRTCAHSTPATTGNCRWSCAKWAADEIPFDAQKTGCDEHRFIPALIKYAKQVDASASENWIEYELADGRRFRNGVKATGSYPSKELQAMPFTLLSHPDVDRIREQFPNARAAIHESTT